MITYTITEHQYKELLGHADLPWLGYLTPNSGEAVIVDAILIEAIEDSVCMGHDAWDLIDPIELVKAVLSCAHTAPQGDSK